MAKNTEDLDLYPASFVSDLRKLMRRQGISQAELARRMSVSPPYISRLLGGKSKLSWSTMQRMSNALGVSPIVRISAVSAEENSSQQQEAGVDSESRPAVKNGGVSAMASADLDPKAVARNLMEKLQPEALAELSKQLLERPRKRQGRPVGSGDPADLPRLDRMADLLAENSTSSEREAARVVAAEEDLGQAAAGTMARRLRRKFAENRSRLLSSARERRRRRAKPNDLEVRPPRERARDGVAYGGSGGTSAPWPSGVDPLILTDQLQRQFKLSDPVVEMLRVPRVLEEIMRQQLALKAHVDATSFSDPIAEELARSQVPKSTLEKLVLNDPATKLHREIGAAAMSTREIYPELDLLRRQEKLLDAVRVPDSLREMRRAMSPPWDRDRD